MTEESRKERIERKLKAGELVTKTDAELEKFDLELKEFEENYAKAYSTKIIKAEADKTKALIADQTPGAEQGVFSFLPTTLTRTSPFFPMSKQEMKDRTLPPGGLTWENPWGKLTISGSKLSIHDESVLLAVLAIMAKNKKGLTFETTRHEICKVMNVNPCKNTYQAIWKSLDRLTGTKINLEIWGNTKGKRKTTKRRMTNTILSGAAADEETGRLTVSLNPYFLEMYAESLVTGLNLKLRAALKGDTSKALYRFFRSQKGMDYECHLLTLCGAINLDVTAELHRLRTRIRAGLRELKRTKYIKRWMLTKSDIVKTWKEPGKEFRQLRGQSDENPHQ